MSEPEEAADTIFHAVYFREPELATTQWLVDLSPRGGLRDEEGLKQLYVSAVRNEPTEEGIQAVRKNQEEILGKLERALTLRD